MALRPWEELPDYMRNPEVRPYYEKLKKHQASLILKRIFDFIVSFIMLMILWPFMLMIGFIIRLDSPGPALFRQERVTTYGKRFQIWKFRTMVIGAEKKYVEKYRPEYYATLLLPAGVTSEASIHYKDEYKLLADADDVDRVYIEKVLPDKMKWNLESIRRFYFLGDIITMFRTVLAILGKDYN